MASVVGEREIDLTKLSLEQLNQLKTQLSEEVEDITRHFATLRDANARLSTCRATVTELGNASEGTEILVPLTQSLYVPGKIKEADKVLIDIGTGYYVEKSVLQAKEYLERRINVVTQNAESVQQVLAQKEASLRMVAGFMNRRIMMMSQQAQQQQTAAKK